MCGEGKRKKSAREPEREINILQTALMARVLSRKKEFASGNSKLRKSSCLR